MTVVLPYVRGLLDRGAWSGSFIGLPSQHQHALLEEGHTPQLELVTHLDPGATLSSRQIELALARPELSNLRSFFQPGRYVYEEGHSISDTLDALFERPPPSLHRLKLTDSQRALPMLTRLLDAPLWERLDTLTLNGLTVYDDAMATLLTGVTLPPSVTLSFARVYNGQIPPILAAADTSRVRHLGLETYSMNQRWDTQTPMIDAALIVLASHHTLTSLTVGYHGIDAEGVRVLTGSPHVHSLRHLRLDGELDPRGVEVLSQSANLDALTHLDLRSCTLSLEAIGRLTDARLPALEVLTILAAYRKAPSDAQVRRALAPLVARGVTLR